MNRVEPAHKQPSKPQTLAEAMEADKLKHQKFQDYMEWLADKKKYQQSEDSS